MTRPFHFFDTASTTPCSEAAAQILRRYSHDDFGNPSSSHALGREAAKAIRDARKFFADQFQVAPEQVVFTGGGTEADNLAIHGIALCALSQGKKPRFAASATEHPAVRKAILSLPSLGIPVDLIPVGHDGLISSEKLVSVLTPETAFVSIHQVNNITGALHAVDAHARLVKDRCPNAIFHSDAVQAFGKVPHAVSGAAIDLVSISGHKVHGPKGVGALIVLNPALLPKNAQSGALALRPLIWGGGQEAGLRSGTQNAGLIAAFHVAAQETLAGRESALAHVTALRDRLRAGLTPEKRVRWNSPAHSIPYVASFYFEGVPAGPLTGLLEERGYVVSTGSACSSHKAEPDAVLAAMGLPPEAQSNSLRVSFSPKHTPDEIDGLVQALRDSIAALDRLLGKTG